MIYEDNNQECKYLLLLLPVLIVEISVGKGEVKCTCMHS
jgi:hypothetical protein